MNWASTAAVVVLLAALGALGFVYSAERQRRHDAEGRATGARLDLEAARDRIAQLQTYLADHESWAAQPSTPVLPRIADPAVPDRWSTAQRPPDDAATSPSLPT